MFAFVLHFIVLFWTAILFDRLNVNMSRDMTKPTKWLCAQRRLRSAWASAQSDQSLRCPHEETMGSQLPIERRAKTLIRLGGCPGWSEFSLGAHTFCWFCQVEAHMFFLFVCLSDCKYLLFPCIPDVFAGDFRYSQLIYRRKVAMPPTLRFSQKRLEIIFRGRCRPRKLKSVKNNTHVFLDETAKIWRR